MADDPFDIANACINGRFNPDHPNISRVYTNVNLDRGPSHWRFRNWNPEFGDINRYTISSALGNGRYSDVYLGYQDGRVKCAIKLLKPVNTDRVRRELKILFALKGHENVLEILDVVVDPREGIPSVITEYVKNSSWKTLFSTMNLDGVRRYMYKLLKGLYHAHSAGIMHRDVKPVNILCDTPRNRVVLADWGLAEFYHPNRKYSYHVATKYYKSPEILLEYECYDYSLDVWSAGVILLELMSMKIHVFDGEDDDHQIDSIADVVGGEVIVEWTKKYRVKPGESVIKRLSAIRGCGFESVIPYSRRRFKDPDALDLLSRMLTVDHKLRITAEEALDHPFFRSVRG